MAFDLGGLQNLLPGGQAFQRIGADIMDITKTIGGVLGGGAAQAPVQQQAAAPADQFQAPAAAAPQQAAAANGTPAQFGQVINQIMQALQQIVALLGGGQGQAQAPAVGVGQGGQAPAQTGGAAPQAGGAAPQAGGAAPQAGGTAPAGGQNAVGGPQVQGGQGTILPQPPVNKNLLLDGTGKVFEGVGEILQALANRPGTAQPGQPDPSQAGGLSTSADAKSVTTSGGYKIQCDGANAWSVTGPDGKPVKVDGDPHVHEGDTNFDFKKDSTFVLPDGTRINCKTKDMGNVSVSDQLEIENNGQRAVMDVSKGDGKVIAQDRGPEQFHTDQTFTMGADGKFGINGKTITGNDGGPDAFKTGGDQQLTQQATAAAGAAAGAGGAGAAGGAGGAQPQGGLAGLMQQIQQMLAGLTGQQPAAGTQQPAAGGNEAGQAPANNQPAAQPPAQQAKPADTLSQLLNSIVQMLQALLPLLGGMAKGGGVAA